MSIDRDQRITPTPERHGDRRRSTEQVVNRVEAIGPSTTTHHAGSTRTTALRAGGRHLANDEVDPGTRERTALQQNWTHQPALDGLRAIAVYLVVVFHSNISWASGGFVGVDVFFVLSGYLVTNVLLNEWSQNQRIELRRFYARRVRRLLPAATVTIVMTVLVSTLVLSRLARQGLIGDAQASLLYVANWNFLSDATDYFGESSQQSPFLHFWSLAIEEQFYFVFPAALIVLLRLSRRHRGIVVGGIIVLFAASLTAQIWVANSNPLRAYYGTDTRIYQMLAGALLATVSMYNVSGRAASWLRNWSRFVTPAALVGLVLVGSSVVSMSPSQRGIAGTALTVLLIYGVVSAPHGRTAVLLSRQRMTYLGRISYGTYLWHWPIIVLLRPLYEPGPVVLALIAIVTATGLAALSARLVESPIRVSSLLDHVPRRTIAAGLALSVAIAALVVPSALASERRPVEAARDNHRISTSGDLADEANRSVPDDLNLEATKPIEIDQTDCTPASPEGCIIVAGSGLHIQLIGDSNAEMIAHAMIELAEDNDWTLSVNTQLGCPWQQGLTWVADNQQRIDNCITARADWYDTYIPALEPDIIMMVGVPRDPQARSDGSVYVAESGKTGLDIDIDIDINDAVAQATDDSVRTITSTTDASVLIIEPLPYALDFDPTECLTTAEVVGDCAYETPTTPLPVELTYRTLANHNQRIYVADIDHIACPYLPACLPMIDGEIVFRNQLHLSDAWTVKQETKLFEIIERTGVLS